jgi:hypothetical protein
MGLMWEEPNWLRRDVLIKKRLGFDDAYWQRAGQVLRTKGSNQAVAAVG